MRVILCPPITGGLLKNGDPPVLLPPSVLLTAPLSSIRFCWGLASLLFLPVNNLNPNVLDLPSPLLIVLQQAPLLVLLEVVVLEHSLQLFRDVSEEVENLLGILDSEGDCPGAETLALPAGGGGPPGLAGGADHLPRRLSSPTRRLCSCPVAVDPRVHAGCSASVFLLLQHLSSSTSSISPPHLQHLSSPTSSNCPPHPDSSQPSNRKGEEGLLAELSSQAGRSKLHYS